MKPALKLTLHRGYWTIFCGRQPVLQFASWQAAVRFLADAS